MIRCLLALCISWFVLTPVQADSPPVYVILWFDTEDYILPASDDAALRLAEWLTKEGVPATFKIVGEKARTLEQRQRNDVIEALKKHEIGYHSNYHSIPPTPAQYLSNLGWDEGVAEFDRREKIGYDDVKRIFGQSPSCYGQPGSSWGPQSFGALRQWGVPVYLDAGRHISMEGRPHYFGGILTLYQLTHTLRTDLGGPQDLAKAEDRFLAARKQLLAEGGGIISTYYHPCEFVHKQFWDGANFTKGANPPREKWQLPQVKTEEESRIAYETFFAYVRFMKRFPEVKFITATQARELYRDRAIDRKFSEKEILQLAAKIDGEIHHQTLGDTTLAPSEIFALLNEYVAKKSSGTLVESITLRQTPYGPTSPAPQVQRLATIPVEQLLRTAQDVATSIQKLGRISGTIWLGSTGVSPEMYLGALARLAPKLSQPQGVPETLDLKPLRLSSTRYVAEDDPRLWGWVIFPTDFRAPAMMELAKQQAWTLKPAVLQTLQK